jgi:hypothetical protein
MIGTAKDYPSLVKKAVAAYETGEANRLSEQIHWCGETPFLAG